MVRWPEELTTNAEGSKAGLEGDLKIGPWNPLGGGVIRQCDAAGVCDVTWRVKIGPWEWGSAPKDSDNTLAKSGGGTTSTETTAEGTEVKTSAQAKLAVRAGGTGNAVPFLDRVGSWFGLGPRGS